MAKPAHKDHRASGRELALSILCDLEGRPEAERAASIEWVLTHAPAGEEPGEQVFAELAADPKVSAFGRTLVLEVEANRDAIDQRIREASARWRLERMDHVDRNVIRLAVAELLSMPGTPRGVVISEAVRLAGVYGSERSVKFVNGLVEALANLIRPPTGGAA